MTKDYDLTTAERLGRHEEKLDSLEKGQCALQQNIVAGFNEVKGDLKELIGSIQIVFQKDQSALEKRIDKVEKALAFVVTSIFSALLYKLVMAVG